MHEHWWPQVPVAVAAPRFVTLGWVLAAASCSSCACTLLWLGLVGGVCEKQQQTLHCTATTYVCGYISRSGPQHGTARVRLSVVSRGSLRGG